MDTEKEYGRRRQIRKPTQIQKAENSVNNPEAAPEAIEKPSEEKEAVNQQTAESAESRAFSEKDRKPDRDRERRSRKPRGGRTDQSSKSRRPPRKSYDRKTSPPRDRRGGFVKLSVIVPAYNEEDNVAPLLEQFNTLFSNLPYKAEMLFIDDGSTDRTLIRAKEGQLSYPWLKVYNHRNNRGLTAALETGFARANGKIFCFYPADLQYHASEIPRLVSKIDSGADIVTGWKKGSYGLKSLTSFVYNQLSRWLFRVKVHDLNSIKAFKRDIIDAFIYRTGWHRYMVVMAIQEGFRVEEVRVKLYPRHSGKSKFGFWRLPAGFLDLLSVKFQISFTRKPLLFFGSAGIISGFLGFIVGLTALYFRFFHNTGYRPLLYMVILLMVSGLMLFAIGFLAELIVSVKEEIGHRRKIS